MTGTNKVVKYFLLIPERIKEYGLLTVLCKIAVDSSIKLGVEQYIPAKIRWDMAHNFHTSWKRSQKERYDLDGYNARIDAKSREILNDFYEVGLNFEGKTVVDVGCGTRGILPIIKAGKKIGVDPTISKAKNHEALSDELKIEYLSDKAEELSINDESVDIVSCNNALNHFQDPDLALAQMHRVLKPDGLFLLEVFIEQQNIAHTVAFTPSQLKGLVSKYFNPMMVKHEQLKVGVEIDENMDGYLPMRWGGVFHKIKTL